MVVCGKSVHKDDISTEASGERTRMNIFTRQLPLIEMFEKEKFCKSTRILFHDQAIRFSEVKSCDCSQRAGPCT